MAFFKQSDRLAVSESGFNAGIGKIRDEILPGSGLAAGTVTEYIIAIIQFLFSLVAILALAALVWGSIMYIISLGDEGRAGTAKKIILYAVIGVLLAGGSFVILQTIRSIFF